MLPWERTMWEIHIFRPSWGCSYQKVYGLHVERKAYFAPFSNPSCIGIREWRRVAIHWGKQDPNKLPKCGLRFPPERKMHGTRPPHQKAWTYPGQRVMGSFLLFLLGSKSDLGLPHVEKSHIRQQRVSFLELWGFHSALWSSLTHVSYANMAIHWQDHKCHRVLATARRAQSRKIRRTRQV